MKAKILAGAVAALMYGTGAGAAEKDCPPGQAAVHKDKGHKDMTAQSSAGQVQEEDLLIEEEAPVDESLQGTGGSGSSGSSMDDSSKSSQSLGTSDQGLSSPSASGTGGSGAVYLNMPLRCEPVGQPGVGGSGSSGITPQSQELTPPPAAEPPAPPPPPSGSSGGMSQSSSLSGQEATGGSGMTTPPPSYAPTASANEEIQPLEVEKKDKNDKKGLTLLIGGGVEGYTGALAPQIAPGPSAAVTASLKPTSVLGVEVGYSGALNNIKDAGIAGADGPDLVRNGGQAALTLAVSPSAVQPYLLGGIGVSNYHFRGGESLGYSDDTVGNIPAGVGVRGHFGHFTADLRGYYNFLFDKQFAPDIDPGGSDPSGGGSYTTTLNVGGTF
ncbi:hypothetical protein JYK02_25085 [Corallococcus macrosporus]|uniref:Outer membrane protein beta-barrel domain-containing protein n=1 Tax=Corallococcus macrosporus TaxID=35 RepID=A0ABS3DHJ2_9BACT|nr:hypothetical protein [Corallococcus macrosporus]MBN8230794.1 hypothetical protein [Corallococcus macrosporus]